MSSPTKINASPMGAREGQRVILREITASLHNSPPSMVLSKNKNVNDVVTKSLSEHEVKVKFAREFGDIANYPPPPSIITEPNCISSASSFQSLTSTLSTKSSSGICVDSPTRSSDASYTNFDVSGLDDIISACAAINLDDKNLTTGENLLADLSFSSATDDLNQTRDLFKTQIVSPNINLNGTQIIADNIEQDTFTDTLTEQDFLPDHRTVNESLYSTVLSDDTKKEEELLNNTFAVPSLPQIIVQSPRSPSVAIQFEAQQVIGETPDISLSSQPPLPTLESILLQAESALSRQLPADIENCHLESSQTPLKNDSFEYSFSDDALQSFPDSSTNDNVAINPSSFVENKNLLNETGPVLTEPTAQSLIVQPETTKENFDITVNHIEQDTDELSTEVATNQQIENIKDQSNLSTAEIDQILTKAAAFLEPVENKLNIDQHTDDLDATVNINDISSNSFDAVETEQEQIEINLPAQEEFNNFLPQRQSTGLTNFLPADFNEEVSPATSGAGEPEFFDAQNTSLTDNQSNFDKLKLEEQSIVNDFNNPSLELIDDNDHSTSGSNNLWRDPSNFDFLLSKKTDSTTTDRLRAESLYVKFDPLVSDISMLPQGNGATAPPNEERNGEKEASVPNIGTPKRNPAIAAIDRLLFYSPATPGNQKSEEPIKITPMEKTTPEPIPIVDSVMAKELELVRATVLQLEEQLEKQKLENEETAKEYKVDREAFQEAITQLQKQLNQEIKSKNQINVVVDEYEKSISRLVAERERDRENLDVEKASLLEELQEVKNHLSASEAAFNDVHAKYERLKVVVTASKNNEVALKESIAENVEIIKTLEDRYDQIKTHAAVRLEKANSELESIRKQHESETLKLRAMLRKEELKSSSLAEMIEQKTKENKELTKILDEVIARVDQGGSK